MPKVSIIVPVYNSAKTIEICIRAILAQSYTDFELLLCNDGSTDGSLAICQKYMVADERVKVIHFPHRGVSAARNEGLDMACGQFVMFADSDDIPDREWVSYLVEHAKPSGLAVCGYSCVDEQGVRQYGAEKNDGETIEGLSIGPGQFIEDIFSNQHMYQGYIWNKIFDHAMIQANKIRFHEMIAYNEDRLFLLNYLFYCQYVNYSNIPLYTYSLHTAARTEYSRCMYTEIDAFEIMRRELYHRKMYSAYHYACKDEMRAILELLPLARKAQSSDIHKLERKKEELVG